jgi:hypothetical protein
MPVLTFDDFAGGLDVRPAAALSKANILRVLTNAYVTTGKSIKKRPCLEKIATLEAGTIGLKAFGGKLNTFYGDGAAITHADSRFVARRLPHHTSGAAPVKIHYCDQYNALMYACAEYSGSVFRHHYLDDPGAWSATGAVLAAAYRRPTVANGFRYEATAIADPGAWAAATAYVVGNFRRPTTANGFRYEVTAIAGGGTSGGVEPTWPTTPGQTVIDNPGANQVEWTCRALVAGAEPAWPTTIGSTVVDNQVTWTCRTFAITDANCPHTKQVTKQAQKIYAVGATDNTTVRYCKTGDPRDWSAVSDAGFIAAGLYAKGSDQVTSIGPFQKSGLAVFFSDNSQVWAVDANPENNTLTDNIEGIGTLFHRASGPVSRDLFFLAQNGFRSVSLIAITDNLQDTDVGSAIDALVTASVASSDDPLSLYYPKLGQFISFNGDIAWSYSFSRTSKISAWSKYTWPFDVDDATVLNQELYVRTGDDVYKVTEAVFKDGVSNIPLVQLEMFAQDGKRPGVLKQFTGLDVIGEGNWTIGHKWYDPDTRTWRETQAYEYPAITEPGNLHPVELMATRIAPVLTHQKDEAAELSSLMLHYENLGAV